MSFRKIQRQAVLVCAALLSMTAISYAADGPVKVFVLAGQSNMEGKAAAYTLEPILADPTKGDDFKHLKTDDGRWTVRDDVWCTFLMKTTRAPHDNLPLHGPLTVGFGSQKTVRDDNNMKISVPAFGPELGIGHVLGDHYDEPVLLIKTAWGGRALKRTFRPPSAMPTEKQLIAELAEIQKKNPDMTLEMLKESYGQDYRAILSEVDKVLSDIETYCPAYDSEKGYEIAGFIWFQGWNDGVGSGNTDYSEQLACFIRDMRKDLDAPGMPLVIGELGTDGLEAMGWIETFRQQQAAVAAMPEFKDDVRLAKTAEFWPTDLPDLSEEWEEFRAKDKAQRELAEKEGRKPDPNFFHREWLMKYKDQHAYTSDKRYHYLGSGECYYRMGDAMGRAMLEIVE